MAEETPVMILERNMNRGATLMMLLLSTSSGASKKIIVGAVPKDLRPVRTFEPRHSRSWSCQHKITKASVMLHAMPMLILGSQCRAVQLARFKRVVMSDPARLPAEAEGHQG